MKITAFSLVLLFCLATRIVFAATEPAIASPTLKPVQGPTPLKKYLTRVGKKLDAGTINFLTGWTEILSKPADDYHQSTDKKSRWLHGVEGFGVGLVYGITDTAGGFLNTATSPLPQFTIPLPQNGVDVRRLAGGSDD